MASAVGGLGPVSQTPNGQFYADARDYGLKPGVDGSGNPVDNAPAIQAAIDALSASMAANIAAGTPARGVVYIPGSASPYYIKSPVWLDKSGVSLVGDRNSTILKCANSFHGSSPASRGSCRRTRRRRTSCSKRRPTGGPTPTARSTRPPPRPPARSGGSGLAATPCCSVQATPFDFGPLSKVYTGYAPDVAADHWTETQQLTIECVVPGVYGRGRESAGLRPALRDRRFGQSAALPFACYSNGDGSFDLIFQTQATRFGPAQRWFVTMAGATTGLNRITWQIDLVNGVVCGWINGVQKYGGAGSAVGSSGFMWPPLNAALAGSSNFGGGLHFLENESNPFYLGKSSSGFPLNCGGGGQVPDYAFYGFAMSASLLYASYGPGTAQTRIDGQTITDSLTYFNLGDPHLIGYMAFTENPTGLNRNLASRPEAPPPTPSRRPCSCIPRWSPTSRRRTSRFATW